MCARSSCMVELELLAAVRLAAEAEPDRSLQSALADMAGLSCNAIHN